MESFLDTFNDGLIIIEKSGKILFVNTILCNKLKVDKKVIESQSIEELLDEKEALKIINCNLEDVVRFNTNKGKQIYFKINASRQRWNGKEAIYIRCNEIEESENEDSILDNNESLYQFRDIDSEFNFISKITDGIVYAVDLYGKIVKVNDKFSKILGWEKDDIINMYYNDVISNEDIKSIVEEYANIKLLNINTRTNICKLLKKDGKSLWGNFTYTFVEEEKLFFCIINDINYEKVIKKSYEDKLELEKTKMDIFSNISHEFKTPLNIILATVQVLNSAIDSKKIVATDNIDIDRYIKYIRQNSYRLLRLVNNLIDINRMDRGYYNINLENNNIIEIVEEITMSVSEYAENKGISIIFDTEVEEQIIACDPDKIERIILNILSNAIKYTPVGGQIYVNMSNNEDDVIIAIEDTGIGISKENLSTIFERYEQIDNEITKKNQGSGIGLSIVKSLVDLHEGNIKVESEFEKGTKFTVTLPIKLVEDVKTIENKRNSDYRIEKCNIEFADIYK